MFYLPLTLLFCANCLDFISLTRTMCHFCVDRVRGLGFIHFDDVSVCVVVGQAVLELFEKPRSMPGEPAGRAGITNPCHLANASRFGGVLTMGWELGEKNVRCGLGYLVCLWVPWRPGRR